MEEEKAGQAVGHGGRGGNIQFLFSESERNEEKYFQVNAVSNATHLLVSKGNQVGQLEVQV